MSHEDATLAGPTDYSTAHLTAITLREAVLKRPHMYFGHRPPTQWPLVLMAWTAAELLDLGRAHGSTVSLTVRTDATFSASVQRAAMSWPLRRAATPEEAIRARMWWSELTRSITVTIARRGDTGQAGEDGRLALDDLDFVVRVEPDADLVGPDPSTWWADWMSHLPDVMTDVKIAVDDWHRIVLIEEASSQRRQPTPPP